MLLCTKKYLRLIIAKWVAISKQMCMLSCGIITNILILAKQTNGKKHPL